MAESLVGELQGRDVLLVVDNCEHLLEGVAGLVGVILAHCPEVRMLLTSRERLGLAGEVVVQVAPLRMPHIAATLPLETLRQFDAVHLFADRATLVLPHFTVSPGNAATVVQICRRLEGMPLALELAAAHMNAISPEGMLARLDDRFRLLGRSRGATGHHRTLRAALDWSHELLAEEEKILFRRLSVFIGDWRLQSAELVCASEPLAVEDVVVLLARLVDKSLVMADPTLAGGRYRFLETVREYARHRLADSSELDPTRERHARHFLAMAETDRPLLRSLERAGWLTRLVEEEGNLRAGLEWSAAADSTEAAEVGLRLATALGPFWESRGLYGEGRYWLDAFLARSPGRTATQGQALYWSGWLAYRASEFDAARARGEDGRSVAEELGDRLLLAMTLHLLGSTEGLMEQRAIGQAYLERSEQLYASLGDPRGLIVVIGQQALSPWILGDLATANALADRGLALAREAHLEVGATVDLVKSFVHLEKGELDEARTRLREGLRRPRQEAMYVCVALEGLAGVAAAEGRSHRALRLASAAMTLVKKWSLHTGPGSSPLYKLFERLLRPAKEGLDTAASAAAAAEGSSMSEDEALEFALSDRD